MDFWFCGKFEVCNLGNGVSWIGLDMGFFYCEIIFLLINKVLCDSLLFGRDDWFIWGYFVNIGLVCNIVYGCWNMWI